MKVIKIIFGMVITLIVLVVAVIFIIIAVLSHRNKNYWKYATAAGDIEKKYTAFGSYDVLYTETDAGNQIYQKYEIWYPSELRESNRAYPLVVMANGTGVRASQYKEVFRHLASWGFIVVGNEDENSRTGASSADSLDFMLKLNADKGSEFYGKIDIDNIGIGGHSQGGVGTINAVTNQENGSTYKAMYTASNTSRFFARAECLGADWSYDVSRIHIPYLMVAGTGVSDAGTAEDITPTDGQGICPLWSMTENYDAISESVTKIMAREVGKEHGDMLRSADGYMTAWFMYWLQDDSDAGDAFFGDNAEILTNTNWQDVTKNQ